MCNLNYTEISSLISNWLQSTSDEQILSVDEELVKKAIKIIIYLHPSNKDEIFLQLCALNFLNAAIKTDIYKDLLSYDLIKSNAAKLIVSIDSLKTSDITYYYNKEENCLFIKFASIVFSFHNVPLTSEILKASFAKPIIWPGIRLQRIAKPLLNHVVKSTEDEIDIQSAIETHTQDVDKKNREKITWDPIDNEYINKNIETSFDENFNEIVNVPIEERENVANGNQDDLDILNGVQLGDDVEISIYGILKSGKISMLTKQFVQLDLKDDKSIRIRCDAISSIESKFSTENINHIDLSFAKAILKDILVAEGLYSSATIDTNATITMVESRRIWFTTDDNNIGSCYKGSIIGYDKEKLVKGQRIFTFPFKKEKAYCVIMEMSYFELYGILEQLLSSHYKDKVSDYKRGQILNLLTFIMKRIDHVESLQKVKGLKRQLKSLMSSLGPDSIEDIKNDDETEIESSHEDVSILDEESSGEIDMPPLSDENTQDVNSSSLLQEEVFKPEISSIQYPKIVGKIDLSEIWSPKNKKEEKANVAAPVDSNDSISTSNTNDLIPSMGKIKKMWSAYGFIKPYNQENDLYFNVSELVSYSGIIDMPNIGDEVIYSLDQNARGPIAVCIHRQCSRDVVEDLVEKYRYNTKICSRLNKHIEDFDNLNLETFDDTNGLYLYLNKVGVNPKTSFSPDNIEKLFSEKLSSDEYAKAIEYLIDEVAKKEPAKCYNLFLRSSSYARSHKMYEVSKRLIKRALDLYKGESGKIKYFNGLLKQINSLSKRIEINESTLTESLEISSRTFPFMPTYVREAILNIKDFKGITLDKETIRTGLYKEEYIEELKENIIQNNADDLLYLTMMKLQLAFHPNEYNPKDDISKFLVNRAKNILAIGDEHRYSDVRYLLRLAYRIKSFEKGFDDTIGLYLMTLGDYSASEIDMYMRGARSNYKFDDLLKNILENEVDNSLELTLLAESNADIKNRIVKEYIKIEGKPVSFDEFPTILNEVKKRFVQYSANPSINFMSFISYLQSTTILLDNEMSIVKNDCVKMVSYVTNFNTGQKYHVIHDAYNNITQSVNSIILNLSSHPTEIGYETILPALKLLNTSVYNKFVEIERRVNPTISIEILEVVGLEDTNSTELKVEIRNSGDSARSVHINRLNVSGDDLAESNNIDIDVPLSAGEDKLINVELRLCDNATEGKIAEVEFNIEYDDIYIATEQRIPRICNICKTINFEIKPFVEIENKFRQCSGGEEMEAGDEMFYGRDKLISDIYEAILKGTKSQIVIYGQKRSGKSSLLNQIKGKLESDESHSVICGKFSLQGLPANELNPVRWILESIVKSLLQGIRKHGIKKLESVLASLSIDIKIAKDKIYDSIISKFFSEESDAFKSLENFVEYINTLDDFQNSHFVIFIDEFTYLYQLIKEKKVNEDFMRRWIACIEMPGMNLQAIVAAQDTLPHFMDESYASNCFNKFSREPLSYLSKEEALQLIKDPIKDVIFHNHSDERIYDYTSGSAFFTQIFCTRLVDYLNSEKSNVVGREEIEIVAERLCMGTQRLEKSTFECLTKEADGSDFNESDNIKVLKAIAEHTRAGGHVTMDDLDIDFGPDKLKSVLDNLSDRRVISRQDKGYSINVKLFVKWILNN